jgi:hypothetical protein
VIRDLLAGNMLTLLVCGAVSVVQSIPCASQGSPVRYTICERDVHHDVLEQEQQHVKKGVQY